MSTAHRSGGSAGSNGGARYETLVAAWYAARAVAGVTGVAILGLPVDTTVATVRRQTAAAVDDILAETAMGGFIFVQCKRKVQLGDSTKSPFASAFSQFVLQWIVCTQGSKRSRGAVLLTGDRDRVWCWQRRQRAQGRSMRQSCRGCSRSYAMPAQVRLSNKLLTPQRSAPLRCRSCLSSSAFSHRV